MPLTITSPGTAKPTEVDLGYARSAGVPWRNKLTQRFIGATCTANGQPVASVEALQQLINQQDNLNIIFTAAAQPVVVSNAQYNKENLRFRTDAKAWPPSTMADLITRLKKDVLAAHEFGARVFVLPEDFCHNKKVSSLDSNLYSKADVDSLEQALSVLGKTVPDMLVVAGTVPWKQGTEFRKRSYILVDGNVITYDKGRYVAGDDTLLDKMFENDIKEGHGSGFGSVFNFGAMQCVVNICADANITPSDADLQIVIANVGGAINRTSVHERGIALVVDSGLGQTTLLTPPHGAQSNEFERTVVKYDVFDSDVAVKTRAVSAASSPGVSSSSSVQPAAAASSN